MSKEQISTQQLRALCKDILAWRDCGILVGGAFTEFADSLVHIPAHYRKQVAESMVTEMAMFFVLDFEPNHDIPDATL